MKAIFGLVTLLLCLGMTQVTAFAAEEYNLEMGQKGISFASHPLSEGYELSYFTAGYDYSGNKTEAERVIPARILLVSEDGSVEKAQQFLSKRFPGTSTFKVRISEVKEVDPSTLYKREILLNKHVFEISSLFPAAVLRHLGRAGEVVNNRNECSNCLGAAKAFHDHQSVGSLDGREFEQFVAQSGLKPVAGAAEPSFGEVLYFPKNEHAAIYLFDNLIFQKPTRGVYHNYEIVPYSDLFTTYNNSVNHYSKGGPAGSYNPGVWDIFVSSLHGASPIGPVPALADGGRVQRFLPTDCNSILR
jgi:hypothetical protein